jgi:3-oxoacyl-[acyl-carrier protein] reductase
LEGTRATPIFRRGQINWPAATSLLKKPADKDDCVDMLVAIWRTETITGQTVVIDSGRYFR